MIPDTIQARTAQLAREPCSLVFLPLAEALRRRGQLETEIGDLQQRLVTVKLSRAATLSQIRVISPALPPAR